jgi:hypothetical protein
MESIFTRDPAPQNEPAPREPSPQGEAGYLKADDSGFFTTEGDLRDIAAGVALKNLPIEYALDEIRAGYVARIAALGAQYAAVMAEINEGIEDIRKRIQKEDDRVEQLLTGLNRSREEKDDLQASLRRLDVQIVTSLQEIRKLRLRHGKEFFEKQGEYLDQERENTKQEVIQDIRDRREIAEEVYKLQKDHWEENKDEFERRAKLFEGELSRAESQLDVARRRTSKLHELGISRTTANFLIWVGYISLAGVGGVIGSFFQMRQTSQTDFLSLVFRGFINLVHLTQPATSGQGSWRIIFAPLPLVGLVVTYLLVIGLIILFMDGRLKKFDPTWGGVGERGRKGRGQRSQSNLLDRFSSYIPTPDVDRKSYRQLLAYFPFIVLATLVVWLFSAGIPQTGSTAGAGTSPGAPDPTLGLATAYLGVIFTLLSTSAALLYATKIIEPRWRKFEDKGQDGRVFDRYLRLNWEVALLMVLLIAALIITAVLPTGPAPVPGTAPTSGQFAVEQYNMFSLGAVAVFMCLCSLGLAYGLIQRGMFRDEDYFERKRQIYRLQIEKNRVGPTLFEIFDRYEPAEEVKSLLNNYRDARHLLDEYRMIYELKEIFDDDFDEDPSLRKVFGKLWPTQHFSLRSIRLRGMPSGEPRPVDYVLAPEETARVLTNKAERRSAQDRAAILDGELQRLEQEKTEAKNRLERLNQEVAIRRRRKLEATQEYELKKSALAERRGKELLKFQSAYAVGRLAYLMLHEDLPPGPPPASTPITPVDVTM